VLLESPTVIEDRGAVVDEVVVVVVVAVVAIMGRTSSSWGG
jgi:hypothetical protein